MRAILAPPPFKIHLPQDWSGPLVLASPHSGRHYPPAFQRQSRLTAQQLRRSEDAYVDLIVADAAQSTPLITANYPRAYVDVNRAPDELDPLLFAEDLAEQGFKSDRAAAGLGVIPRIVASGMPIYRDRLSLAEAQHRLERVHQPYHEALASLTAQARQRFGWALLLDCHSMPTPLPDPPPGKVRAPDIVLGDLFGRSCDEHLVHFLANQFERRGYDVALNEPYAGGYCTRLHGQPGGGCHAIQIEIARSLYMSEATLKCHGGFNNVRQDFTSAVAALSRYIAAQGGFQQAAE